MGDSLVDSSLMLKADLEVDDDILLDDDEEDNNDLDEESESSSYEEVVPEKNEVGEAAKKPGVARGKPGKSTKLTWNEAQRAKVYYWYKMGHHQLPSERRRVQFVQKMWKEEFKVQKHDTTGDPAEDISTHESTESSPKRDQPTYPSRVTILKLVKCYDNNMAYTDGRASNSNKVNRTPEEVITRVESRLDEMFSSKQEITLRPLGKEFGVSISTISRLIRAWADKRKIRSLAKAKKKEAVQLIKRREKGKKKDAK